MAIPDFSHRIIEYNILGHTFYHSGFNDNQWVKEYIDEDGEKVEDPLDDAICSFLTNCEANYFLGVSKHRYIPLGKGWYIDLETRKAH